ELLREQDAERESEPDPAQTDEEALLQELPRHDPPTRTEGACDADFPEALDEHRREPVEGDQEPDQQGDESEAVEHQAKAGDQLANPLLAAGRVLDRDPLREPADEAAAHAAGPGVLLDHDVALADTPLAQEGVRGGVQVHDDDATAQCPRPARRIEAATNRERT